ncbi:MAG: serine/threonine protein kinase, partial [Acidobacteria bacterium]|nr:serine/threonine protein kinase [Acidobacteriota bacterium]
PANIMLDGHGRVRITDFGLAIAQEDESQAAEIAGTPAYMAPEQLAGKGSTVRSDMYSLGLVLYEIYTGKKAFTATNLAELRQQKETHTPRAPSEIREGIDPVVERVIQRCMEKEPNARPSSVAQLAQALPGGDPLAAAIAAGETPSPEMVAASESTEGLKPWIAWSCLAFIILSIGTYFILTQQTSILYRVPIEQPPEVMVKTAQDILKDLGYTEEHADSAFRFMSATSKYFDYVERTDQSSDRFEKIPALTIQFWYRQSPMLLLNISVEQAVTLSDPPFLNNGESIVWLDSRGRLAGLRVIPPQKPKKPDAVQSPNWSILFKAAGLDEKSFNDAETESIPPVYADTRAAWTGTLPDFPDTAVHIEAAACQGRPVFWQMIVPSWDNFTTATLPSGQILPGRAYNAVTVILAIVVVLILVAGPAFFAHRNLRMGRGDRRGATRLVLFSISLWFISWVFNEHHIAAAEEVYLFIITVTWCLLFHGWYWLMYIAFEPFTRRRLPRVLVGWSRLLAGKYWDPLVGRDLLVGFVTGMMVALIEVLIVIISHSLGDPQLTPFIPELTFFAGPRWIVEGFLRYVIVGGSILFGLSIAFIVFLLRILLRSTWATAIVPILLFSSLVFVFSSSVPVTIIATLYVGFLLYVFLRFGLVSLMASLFVFSSLQSFPITIQQSAWYFEIGLTGLVLLLIFTLYAFRTSLGGRPIFGTPRLDE